jgi:hypothetical protein
LHLKSRCLAAKAGKPEKRYIVGIPLDARDLSGSSKDFIFLDTANRTDEAMQRARKLREDFGYFKPGEMIEG